MRHFRLASVAVLFAASVFGNVVAAESNSAAAQQRLNRTSESVVLALSDRYVSTSGTDAGTCSTSGTACLTIQYAVDQAGVGDTIHIDSGTYNGAVTVVTDGLKFIGEGPTQPTLSRFSGGPNQPIIVINGAQGVGIDNLAFDMDISHVAEGILASGFVDGLDIRNSQFSVRQTGAGAASYGYRNAITINNTRNSLSLPRVDGSSVTIDNNVIDGINANDGSFLRAGVNMDAGVGVISNNVIRTINHDINARFSGSTMGSSSTSLNIVDNQLNGRGLELASPNATTTEIIVQGNQFDASSFPGPVPNQADFASVRLIRNASAVPTVFDGNTVAGFGDNYRGMLVENWPAVQLTGNTFTPLAGATDFVSLVLSNKEVTSDAPPSAPETMSIDAMSNVFNGSGVVGAGRGVVFLNDNDAAGTATFGALIFGSNGAENTFDPDHGWYFVLDDHDCDTHVDNSGSGHPLCTFLDYQGTAGGATANTEVRPFRGNVSAIHNLFDGIKPVDMSASQRIALEVQTLDDASNPALGHVDYGFADGPELVYVDDDYLGASYGDEVTFSNSATSNASVFYGVNAFDSIADAIAAVAEDGTVYVADGSYVESPVVGKRLSLVGDGSTATTTINGSLSIGVSGADAMNPLLFSGLVVSNPAGDGLVLAGSVSFLRFEGVAFENNSANGVNFNGSGNEGIAFVGTGADCRFNGNQIGVRTGTTAVASSISFDGCEFSGNERGGIILFGASGSGNGQISDWSVANSTFAGNDSSDATGFGGGIWIKTGGAGSVIDGFHVSDSTFEDNGSSNALNQVGITLRARPGTTLANVSICNNLFAETTALGTQSYGILVFDDTGNSGYEPVVVCDNTFDGPITGVSGTEQEDTRDTQPVVILDGNDTTGGAIERDLVNDPVVNLDTMEMFATIGDALADPDTINGHTIQAGIGSYAEAVSINHDGLTLQGVGSDTTIYGAGIAASGVTINGHDGVTIANLNITDFTAIPAGGACVHTQGSNAITIDSLLVSNCQGGVGGIYVNGPVDDVTISNNEVTNVGPGGARGIVVWNGLKTNITITNNNVHDIAGCCGIELQDGTASGVTVTGNTVERVGDSGMAFTGLMSGAGPNLIANNTITDTGRFGMEIKLPNGTGLDSGDGSIVVRNNNVSLSGSFAALKPGEERDIAGIAVMRRSYVVAAGNVDIPTGVIVRNNTVSGYVQDNISSDSEGFGIVLEGTSMQANGNTVSNSDVGIQRQQGHQPYSANVATDGDQSDLADQYFGRGNSPLTCASISGSSYSGNGVDQRDVGGNMVATVTNIDTSETFCQIQAAIDDAGTVAGHTIQVGEGSYQENVTVDKSVAIEGPFAGTAGNDVSRDGTGEAVLNPASGRVIQLQADGIRLDGLTLASPGADLLIGSGQVAGGGDANNVEIVNNRLVDSPAVGIYIITSPPTRLSNWTIDQNLFSNLSGASTSAINFWYVDGGIISDNVIDSIDYAGIQLDATTDTQISGNSVSNVGAQGIQLASGVANVSVHDNTLNNANTSNTAHRGAIRLYADADQVSIYCNSINVGTGLNGLALRAASGPVASSPAMVFHNRIIGADSAYSERADGPAIGSNWYGGGSATVAGSEAGSLLVANPLPADPIGNVNCGDNDIVAMQLVSGSPQSAVVTQTFAASLQARAIDVLGGAVPGSTFAFTVPASGASAALDSMSGSADFNGEFGVTATANSTSGSYLVTADSAPPTGSPANFSLTNLAAALNSLSMVSGNAQSGIAGLALDDPLVVSATDAFGNPVTGAPVGFTITAGGGSIAAPSTVTDAAGLASSGAWTLGRDAGANSADASVIGNPGIAPVAFNANGSEQADIAISKSSTQATVEPGETIDYLLSVTNAGPSNATAVDVLDALPVELDIGTAGWVCVASSEASCASPNGVGSLSLVGNVIPVGGSISVLLSADVLPSTQNGVFTNTAMADLTSGDDPNTANDLDDRDVEVINATPLDPDIFMDGFEGDSVPFAPPGSGSLIKLTPDWSQVIDLATPVRLLGMPDQRGKVAVELIGFRSGGQLWVRLGGRDAAGGYQRSNWLRISAGELSLGWVIGESSTLFALDAGDQRVELRISGELRPSSAKAAAGSMIH